MPTLLVIVPSMLLAGLPNSQPSNVSQVPPPMRQPVLKPVNSKSLYRLNVALPEVSPSARPVPV